MVQQWKSPKRLFLTANHFFLKYIHLYRQHMIIPSLHTNLWTMDTETYKYLKNKTFPKWNENVKTWFFFHPTPFFGKNISLGSSIGCNFISQAESTMSVSPSSFTRRSKEYLGFLPSPRFWHARAHLAPFSIQRLREKSGWSHLHVNIQITHKNVQFSPVRVFYSLEVVATVHQTNQIVKWMVISNHGKKKVMLGRS